jgi:predicted phosphodiesterase
MRIGIISDIHEDAIRLQQAITVLEKGNCNFNVCLGDMAGFDYRFYSYQYTRNLNYCLSVIRANCRYVITGNHDLFVLKKIPRWNQIFNFPENWFTLTPAERTALSKGIVWSFEHDIPVKLHPDHIEWYHSLEEYFIFETNGYKILFSHSLFPDPTGMLTRKPVKYRDFTPHLDLLTEKDCDLGISGHLHPNGVFRITTKKNIPGKFGQFEIVPDLRQLVCPCIAESNQDNGITILDLANKTIEAIPLRTPRHQIIW